MHKQRSDADVSSELCLLWHQADTQTAVMNVRFEGNKGHEADVMRCLLMTQSGHAKLKAQAPQVEVPAPVKFRSNN